MNKSKLNKRIKMYKKAPFFFKRMCLCWKRKNYFLRNSREQLLKNSKQELKLCSLSPFCKVKKEVKTGDENTLMKSSDFSNEKNIDLLMPLNIYIPTRAQFYYLTLISTLKTLK